MTVITNTCFSLKDNQKKVSSSKVYFYYIYQNRIIANMDFAIFTILIDNIYVFPTKPRKNITSSHIYLATVV